MSSFVSSSLSIFAVLLAAQATAPAQTAAADWQYPLGVAQDHQGRILIVDRKYHGILALSEGGLTDVYEGSKKFRTPLNAVYCIHVAKDGAIYVGDSATREVYRVSEDGKLTALTSGIGDKVGREEYHPGKIGIPTQIATNSQGDVFVTDLELQRVWKIPAAGGEPVEFAVVAGPRGVAVDSEDHVWILSPQKPQLRRVSPDGKQSEVLIDDLVFNFPHQVVVLPDGNALVTDGYEHAVWKVVRADKKATKLHAGDPFVNPVGICLIDNGQKALVIDPRALPAPADAAAASPDAERRVPALFEIDLEGNVTRRYPASPEK